VEAGVEPSPFLPLTPFFLSFLFFPECSGRSRVRVLRNSSPILIFPDLKTSLHDLLLPHLDQQPRPALIPLIDVSKTLGANPVGQLLVT
jgi:hypothetical protein